MCWAISLNISAVFISYKSESVSVKHNFTLDSYLDTIFSEWNLYMCNFDKSKTQNPIYTSLVSFKFETVFCKTTKSDRIAIDRLKDGLHTRFNATSRLVITSTLTRLRRFSWVRKTGSTWLSAGESTLQVWDTRGRIIDNWTVSNWNN